MKGRPAIIGLGLLAVFGFTGIVPVRSSVFHCDGLEGPVVKAAQGALESGNINLVLVWVAGKDEPEIRKAFERAMAVRKKGREAQELADTYFFETVVRIHRASEGAPYSGLKPAGRDLGPAIPAAEKAIADGSREALTKLLVEALERGLEERFHRLLEKRGYPKDNVEAGRGYVRSYVDFIHYVERLHQAAGTEAGGHFPEHEEPPRHP